VAAELISPIERKKVMKRRSQYSGVEARDRLLQLLRQWDNNAAELHSRCEGNRPVSDSLIQLHSLFETLIEWIPKDGKVTVFVQFQPHLTGMDAAEEYGDVPF
jgi:hypothetical protein